ncbi:ribosome silencing factor [Ornithobacterium rhinotracheale]|uniref:Ribosomal silencing factor RsfS n=1 Tax=Ornithobacterium rhinotracheale (strain ATCC 51463 / DSM 15997 / CCUG 23171 / CIP 104009 / LMG 9086) TaxID=867902 RepID=I4A2C0_ORNRL|nr:ribosome silencing factor [Ornithobacterium rhinotracheale]AFL98104.1 iojap-like ribosome-associated protein [Ornithobacterium rhinotracheale DSM 15997]AIP99870.1 ribosome-associated protein IOJAP [Ornithobacterium rhinotracheale ORT-UMN 88]KGB66051.1 ribosome-associated protein IOJAP [Ornithobacterium rhinotracheale H06-030791]MBN3661742.1 ribosome silencing factor [Ornithobacterium rhinotracheale]MCK0193601.1 ribosome silencing factor [Ornithobacterium rhinotracheale]
MSENSSKKLLDSVVLGIEDLKGEDITVLDLREIENAVCDYFVVCTGNSNTQVSAIANSIERTVRKENKERPISVEGKENAMWVLLDYASVVVHVFQRNIREYYDIESMWGDAKTINVQPEKSAE